MNATQYTAQFSAANACAGDMTLTIDNRIVWPTAHERLEVFAEILAIRVGENDRLTGIDRVEPARPGTTSFLLHGDIRTVWVHVRFTDRPGVPGSARLVSATDPRFNGHGQPVPPELASQEVVCVEWPLFADVGRAAIADLIREKVGPSQVDAVEGVVPGLGKFRVTRPESPEFLALRREAGIREPMQTRSLEERWTDLIRNGMLHSSMREDMLSLVMAYTAFRAGLVSRTRMFQHRAWAQIDDRRTMRPFERGVDPVASIALFVAESIEIAANEEVR